MLVSKRRRLQDTRERGGTARAVARVVEHPACARRRNALPLCVLRTISAMTHRPRSGTRRFRAADAGGGRVVVRARPQNGSKREHSSIDVARDGTAASRSSDAAHPTAARVRSVLLVSDRYRARRARPAARRAIMSDDQPLQHDPSRFRRRRDSVNKRPCQDGAARCVLADVALVQGQATPAMNGAATDRRDARGDAGLISCGPNPEAAVRSSLRQQRERNADELARPAR